MSPKSFSEALGQGTLSNIECMPQLHLSTHNFIILWDEKIRITQECFTCIFTSSHLSNYRFGASFFLLLNTGIGTLVKAQLWNWKTQRCPEMWHAEPCSMTDGGYRWYPGYGEGVSQVTKCCGPCNHKKNRQSVMGGHFFYFCFCPYYEQQRLRVIVNPALRNFRKIEKNV